MTAVKPEKTLLVTYLFPPAGGVAVQRALSLARYLPENGHELHVLCCRNPTVPQMDPGLLRRVPPGLPIHRVFSPEIPFKVRHALWRVLGGGNKRGGHEDKKPAEQPASHQAAGGLKSFLRGLVQRVLNPDPEIIWAPGAYLRAVSLIRKHGITNVIVTAPPFSSFLIGMRLKRKFPHIKFIADFRDDWIGYYLKEYDYYRSEIMARRAVQLERETVEAASLVVSVTASMLDSIRQRHPSQPSEKFALIPNGYDPAMFTAFQPRSHGTGKIVVTYTGTLHPSSSPKHYLDALDSLPEALRSRFETRFVGRIAKEVEPLLEGRKSLIRTYGWIPQAEALRLSEETDYLLLIMLFASAMTGKVFEYMATGKPVLAVGPPEGELAMAINDTRVGWCADPNKPEEVRAMLERAAAAVDSGAPFQPRTDLIQKYDRSRQAAEYSRLIQASRP